MRTLLVVLVVCCWLPSWVGSEANSNAVVELKDQLVTEVNSERLTWSGIKGNVLSGSHSVAQLRKDNIDQAIREFLLAHQASLQIQPSNLILKQAETDGRFWFITYRQSYQSVQLWGTEVGFTIASNGDIIYSGGTIFPQIKCEMKSSFSEEDAIYRAELLFRTHDIDSVSVEGNVEKIIYPMETKSRGPFVLVYKISLSSQLPLKKWIYFINAQNGKCVYNYNAFVEGDWINDGYLRQGFWPQHHYDPIVIEGVLQGAANLRIYNYISGDLMAEGNTDSQGYYYMAWRGSSASHLLNLHNVSLVPSSWVTVEQSPAHQVEGFVFYPSARFYYDFNATDETNVFHHVNRIHNLYASPPFSYTGMDYQMVAKVRYGGDVNGRSDGTNIDFGYQNGQYWARSSDVVYHEYTHSTIYHIYGGWIGTDVNSQAKAMNEGLPDYFACSINNDPAEGEDCGVTRNLFNSWTLGNWRENDFYFNSQIISGACWDLRRYVGASVSDVLVFKALQITPHARDFTSMGNNILIADDMIYGDGNPNNGTPHDSWIGKAFANHGIALTIVPHPASAPQNLSGYAYPCIKQATGAHLAWSPPSNPGWPIYTYYEIWYKDRFMSDYQWLVSVTEQEVPFEKCFASQNCPISFKVRAQNNGEFSNIWILYAIPGGDPLISDSRDSLATGYPNGQKVVLDHKDRLHVVFTSGDTVFYTNSNKKAKKWSAPVTVGLGKFPAIAMDSHDNPHVLWTSGTQVLSSQLSNGVWTTPYSLFNSSGATVEAPSFVINTANDSGFASWTVVTTTSSEVSLASFIPGDTTAPVSIQRVDSGGTTSFASPSLALDPTGKVLVSWSREGEVYFQERGGSILNLSQSPGALSIHPVVDAYGDRVSVTYQEQDLTWVFKIKRVVKEDGAWGTPQPINLFSGNALFPVAAGASQVAFSSDVAGRREIYYQGEYEDGGVITGTTFSASSEGLAHNYPSIALDNDWPNATLHCVWTGELVTLIYPVKTLAIEIPPVPLVFVDPGKSTPSSHTIQRAGTIAYGSQPYLTADTHPQKLIYRFSGLNPNKRYRLGATYYFEKPGETWRMRLKVDGRDGMRTRIPTNTRVDDSDWLPRSVYQDGVIDVEITLLEGDFALCNELALFEFNSGSGGPQEEEGWSDKPLPLTYALGQSFPNPFKDKATISYQLPEETPVSLKVFNVTGQVVRELASGKQKAGFYNAVWDGKDGSGREVSSGIYFYRLDAGGFTKTNKLVVVK